MKLVFLLPLLWLLLFAPSANGAISSFMTHVNSAWAAKNYDEILQLANTESQAIPVNPEAFVVLYEYDLIVLGNNQQALHQLDLLISALSTVRPAAVSGIQQYRTQALTFQDFPITPSTSQQLNPLHTLFPSELPGKDLLILISSGN